MYFKPDFALRNSLDLLIDLEDLKTGCFNQRFKMAAMSRDPVVQV
jgi:hypothetical protein